MILFTKNYEKFDHLKIQLCHYDFFVTSNVLTGAPKNVKICLYCIWHGNYSFLGNFFAIFHVEVKRYLFTKNDNFSHFPENDNFHKFSKNVIFVKMEKSGVS